MDIILAIDGLGFEPKLTMLPVPRSPMIAIG
jgi:hypothetical protein